MVLALTNLQRAESQPSEFSVLQSLNLIYVRKTPIADSITTDKSKLFRMLRLLHVHLQPRLEKLQYKVLNYVIQMLNNISCAHLRLSTPMALVHSIQENVKMFRLIWEPQPLDHLITIHHP
jgi:hypothetical protein